MKPLKSPLAVLALVVGIGAVTACLVAGDPIRQSKWDRIQEGMTKDQVLKILGKPEHSTGDQITYSGFLNAGWVAFTFDGKGFLIGKNDESVFGSLR